MAKSTRKEELSRCLRSIALSGLSAFGMYFVSSLLLMAATEDKTELRDMISSIFMALAYTICLYHFHMRDRLNTYATHSNSFDVKAELKAFLRGEGKIILMIYGICAVAAEIDLLIPRATASRPVAMVCSLCITMICGYFPIPVLRSILAFVISAVMVCLLAMLRSWKVYRDER